VTEKLIETTRLFVVSRESTLLAPLWSMSESNSWQIETAASAWEAIDRIQSGPVPHLLLLDLPRGDGDAQHILRWVRRIHPTLPVVVVCFSEDADRNEEAIRFGAQEVLIKPLDDAQLEWVIQQHLFCPVGGKRDIASEDIEQLGPDSFFVSASPVSQKLRTQVQLLAEADVPILILGEAGSGKDAVARLIHKVSIRSAFEFHKVNCADMPAELLELELFGNSLPSDGRIGTGKFERADKGTIFFDEITEMPLSIQGRLMHVLQNKAAHNSAMNNPSPDFRVVAATSGNIDRALAERRLREDLYYRLSAFIVQVPSLWQRRSEIAVLMQHLMHRLSRQYGLPPRSFSPSVLNACRNYSWPGNLKELESFIKRYLMVGEKDLNFNAFRPELMKKNGHNPLPPTETKASFDSKVADNEPEDDIDGSARSSPKSLKSLIDTVKSEAERNAIGIALQKTGWNRKAAARLLQVSYRTLLYKIDQYHMSSSDSVPSPVQGNFPLHDVSKGNGKNGRAAS
jgi:DNA-binding NtrC family response regulator